MKKLLLYFIAVLIIVVITVLVMFFARGESQDTQNIKFLENYGWEVEKECIELCQIQIPTQFDDIYRNYNILQKEAGLDLTPYQGRIAVRYTYLVTNYPEELQEPVRANVVCVDGVPVAGDIMTVSFGGFMYSLSFNQTTCFSNEIWMPV